MLPNLSLLGIVTLILIRCPRLSNFPKVYSPEIYFSPLPFYFRLQPVCVFNGISPFLEEFLFAVRISPVCIEQIGIKLAVIAVCRCMRQNKCVINRLQRAMAKRMVRTWRVDITGKPAAVQHQALLAMSFALRVVPLLDPLRKITRLPYKCYSCTPFIVHDFFSFSYSKNKSSSTCQEQSGRSCMLPYNQNRQTSK